MKKILFLITAAVLTLTACHDDASLYGDGANTVGGNELRVIVPLSRANADGSLTEDEKKAIYFTTEEECKINTLRIIVFKKEGDKLSLAFNEAVTDIPAAKELNNHTTTTDNTYAQQTIETVNKVTPGEYKVYVVANYNDYDATSKTYTEKKALGKVTTEEGLKALLLEYDKDNMPEVGNLPMVYVPRDAGDNTETVTVTASEGATVKADLQFTCAKVRYNLIFDKSSDTGDQTTKTNFGTNFLGITSVDGKQFSPEAPLIWDGEFTRSYTKPPFTNKSTFGIDQFTTGEYYDKYTLDATKTGSNELMVTVPDDATKLTNVTKTDKWLYQGTCYVPERFVTSDADQSYLQFNGQIYDSNGSATTTTNKYTVPIGHNDSKSDSHKYLPRSTFYEIVGNIETIGSAKLKTTVNYAAWQNVAIAADFSHTTLWVSKTTASVTSLANDYIDYTTNASDDNITFGCDTKIDDKSVIIIANHDKEKHRVEFKINPAITYDKFTNAKGTVKVWIKANNLIKYLDVTYDVSPLFDVSPEEVIIYYTDGGAENAKAFTWTTNLGGIDFGANTSWTAATGGTSTIGTSTIKIECTGNTSSTGTFTVTATTNPITPVTHTFTVRPVNTTYQTKYAKTIKVTVKPPIGDYIINFRAINDRQEYTAWNKKNGNTSNALQKTLEEDTSAGSSGKSSNNWNDGWQDNSSTANQITDNATLADTKGENHHVYIYSQLGETSGTGAHGKAVWQFNTWPGEWMSPDYNNPGWYRKVLSYYAVGIYNSTNDDAFKKNIYPSPAKTLMIFINKENFPDDDHTRDASGYTLHRCTHHEDAGIMLFDYEDREGWIVYDPTTSPYYQVYDEKPTIEDVIYTVYTKSKVTGWEHTYGVAQEVTSGNEITSQFKISSDATNNTCIAGSSAENNYYKTTITLKAAKGHHAKVIKLNLSNNSQVTLFGGTSYEKYKDTGYYDGTSWHTGTPK